MSTAGRVRSQLERLRDREITRHGLEGVADVRVIVRVTLWEAAVSGRWVPVLTGGRDAVLRHVREAPAGREYMVALPGQLPFDEEALSA